MTSDFISTETEYIIDAGRIHCKVKVDDITNTITDGGHCLGKFNGASLDTLRSWLYNKVDKTYTIKRQGKLGENLK